MKRRKIAIDRFNQLKNELSDIQIGLISCRLLGKKDARRVRQLRANAIIFELFALKREYGLRVPFDQLKALLESSFILDLPDDDLADTP